MRSSIALIVAAALAWSAPAYADDWVSGGEDAGYRVGINFEGIPGDKTGPFFVRLAMIPRNWPANSHAYDLLIAEFDCQNRTRAVTTRIEYSGRHDPRTTRIEAPVKVGADSDAAIAAQLDLVCSPNSQQGREHYGSLRAFVDGLDRRRP